MAQADIPLALPSHGNARYAHYGQRAKLIARQRRAILRSLPALLRRPELPVSIGLWRVSKLPLDDDNQRPAMKAVRDAIAEWLGLRSDRDQRVRWLGYGHIKAPSAKPGYQAARILIAPGHEDCPHCGAPIVDGRFLK